MCEFKISVKAQNLTVTAKFCDGNLQAKIWIWKFEDNWIHEKFEMANLEYFQVSQMNNRK